ncbi:glycosyltransferase family 2 protein [Serpula lacrymans var. lacrymans S7.9]|uniref:chitin synthase n=1 Tax=Serpula lacrymans var. lacrymans (strain S7.9) TaxID=578457 RepID=F8PAT9_SERL9|nr:glycosyltransferase family 2 protein [Serpula lacrymans var. lacrymans S7.9]EGO19927.1 glycosyltransferase family 2 protein [Serpula lacrymans var. lacrymans S7.9]
MVAIIAFKFIASLNFGSPRAPEDHNKSVICQVPCYTNPMELEMYHQIKNIIGVNPTFYKYIFTVDADTVEPLSVNRLISAMIHDKKVLSVCGETELTNTKQSIITMMQVYEYFISHHMAKVFESLFGSVTCLPGCFTLYRLRTPDTHKPLLISNQMVQDYSENRVDTLHMKNLLHLGEDRYLRLRFISYYGNHIVRVIARIYDMARGSSSDSENTDSDRVLSNESDSGNENRTSLTNPFLRDDASLTEYKEAVKAMQLQMAELRSENRELKRANAIMKSNQPKRRTNAVPKEISTHDVEIARQAKKYGIMVDMHVNTLFFRKQRPDGPCPDSEERYASPLAEEQAQIIEIYEFIPEHLHCLMRESHHFGNIFSKKLCNGRLDILHKIRTKAGIIYDLPEHVFETTFDRSTVPELRALLGVDDNRKDAKYPMFPPVLFPNFKVDMKYIFGNPIIAKILKVTFRGPNSLSGGRGGGKSNANAWHVTCNTPGSLAWGAVAAVFLASPDDEFPHDGKGAISHIQYFDMFRAYKQILVKKGGTRCIKETYRMFNAYIFSSSKVLAVVPKVHEDYTDQIELALAALDVQSDDDSEIGGNNELLNPAQLAVNHAPVSNVALSTLGSHAINSTTPLNPDAAVVSLAEGGIESGLTEGLVEERTGETSKSKKRKDKGKSNHSQTNTVSETSTRRSRRAGL